MAAAKMSPLVDIPIRGRGLSSGRSGDNIRRPGAINDELFRNCAARRKTDDDVVVDSMEV